MRLNSRSRISHSPTYFSNLLMMKRLLGFCIREGLAELASELCELVRNPYKHGVGLLGLSVFRHAVSADSLPRSQSIGDMGIEEYGGDNIFWVALEKGIRHCEQHRLHA